MNEYRFFLDDIIAIIKFCKNSQTNYCKNDGMNLWRCRFTNSWAILSGVLDSSTVKIGFSEMQIQWLDEWGGFSQNV